MIEQMTANGTVIWGDGSYNEQRRIGGFGIVITEDAQLVEKYAEECCQSGLTSTRVEIIAFTTALQKMADRQFVYVTDCDVILSVTDGRLADWQATGWRSQLNPSRAVTHIDLWENIASLLEQHPGVNILAVPAHKGHAYNEEAHRLARLMARLPPPRS